MIIRPIQQYRQLRALVEHAFEESKQAGFPPQPQQWEKLAQAFPAEEPGTTDFPVYLCLIFLPYKAIPALVTQMTFIRFIGRMLFRWWMPLTSQIRP